VWSHASTFNYQCLPVSVQSSRSYLPFLSRFPVSYICHWITCFRRVHTQDMSLPSYYGI
jgi:hypothetical protein